MHSCMLHENATCIHMLETLSWTALNRCPTMAWQAVQIPLIVRQPHFGLSSYRIFLRENHTSCHFYCQIKIISHNNLLLHFNIKAKTHRWHNHWYWVGAACRPSLSCGQRMHNTTLAWAQCVQHSTEQDCIHTDSLLGGSLNTQ